MYYVAPTVGAVVVAVVIGLLFKVLANLLNMCMYICVLCDLMQIAFFPHNTHMST